ncbi:MAG: hypothetical protein KJ995_06425 [Candidatus Omnitrophica bacterium]|nr:hypothetical protein [Candidatus Omnitrophota bacterium]MBU1128234.1 hypothetical protein [Candidatus Omnitrophota bacterium]MBU1784215.1 hypothetical protein [Candidatus Omnitrophota bacterium]MBU1852018.1 hypothetical protein [Candidatus Omnitrophota bacterium]
MKKREFTQKIAYLVFGFLGIMGMLKNCYLNNVTDHEYLGDNFPAGTTGRIDHESFSHRT